MINQVQNGEATSPLIAQYFPCAQLCVLACHKQYNLGLGNNQVLLWLIITGGVEALNMEK